MPSKVFLFFVSTEMTGISRTICKNLTHAILSPTPFSHPRPMTLWTLALVAPVYWAQLGRFWQMVQHRILTCFHRKKYTVPFVPNNPTWKFHTNGKHSRFWHWFVDKNLFHVNVPQSMNMTGLTTVAYKLIVLLIMLDQNHGLVIPSTGSSVWLCTDSVHCSDNSEIQLAVSRLKCMIALEKLKNVCGIWYMQFLLIHVIPFV